VQLWLKRKQAKGESKKKIVVVKSYRKKDGTKVGEYRRSTPN
jgi:hypothetical protein